MRDNRANMRRFIIEQQIPGIGSASAADFCAAAERSKAVLSELGPRIQWIESYASGDKTFCIDLAADEEVIRLHAEISGFPAIAIHEMHEMIDPITARPDCRPWVKTG